MFHHPLIRAVAYESQLKSDRVELHRRVAAAIERHGGSTDENAALIAEHLEAAGDLDAAYDLHMRAGAWSLNRDSSAARASWVRARQVADALGDDHPNRTPMRIGPRSLLIATGWRVHANDADSRFEELRELCAAVGDKHSLAVGMSGQVAGYMQRAEMREASQLASEHLVLVESIGNPGLAFGGMLLKAQVGEVDTVMRWAQTIIDWADGDPAKGNLVVGSPLAVAYAMRAYARWWFGQGGSREDIDRAVALGRDADALTLAVVLSWRGGMGVLDGVLRADDELNAAETAREVAEQSGDDYAVAMVKGLLGSMLLYHDAEAGRDRGLAMLAELRELCLRQRYPLSELPLTEFNIALERVRRGDDRDGSIKSMRDSLNLLFDRGQVAYTIAKTCALVETLLGRGRAGDTAEAEAAVHRLAALQADGSAVRDIYLLRCRMLLARARGDDTLYLDLRDRYREKAHALGFEGHIASSEAMP